MNRIFNIDFINMFIRKCLILFLAITFIFQAKAFNHKTPFIHNIVNHAPVFSSSSYFFSISEEAALGASTGSVSATDEDGDQLKFSIKSGNTISTLRIDSLTGSIFLAKRLNYHTLDSFFLILKVADPGGLSSQVSVIISVTKAPTDSIIDNLTWGTAASQQYTVNESQGEVVNGKLYTFGGFDSQKPSFTPTSRAYVYDPLANTWASIAPMPPMNGTNYGGVTHAGFTTDGTDIYFAGGYTSNSTGTGQKFGTKEAWKYIVEENRYVRLPDLPIAIAAGQLEYLAGKLHHISGTNAARTVDLGDHYVLNLDSLSTGWKKLSPLPNPRQHAGSVVYENKIYYIGGQHGQDGKLVAQKDVHVYDPRKDTWTKLADLPVPAGAMGRGHISSATIVIAKNIVVVAGETVHNTGRTNMVSAYAPQTNTWQNLTPLPQTRYSGVAANLGGLIYYTGGSKTNVTYKGSPSSATQSVQSLTLINAQSDQPIKTLVNGDTLDFATLPSNQLNILAITNPAKVGSVRFEITGPLNSNIIENTAPYALFGDDGSGDFNPWTPALGKYTLKVTPYASSGATGTEGLSQTVIFTVINSGTVGQNISLTPLADASVRKGSYGNINYGSEQSLLLKSSPSAEYTRYAYLKFSLASISNVNSATLRLYGHITTSAASKPVSVYGVNDDQWTEMAINFNNAPVPLSTALSSANVSSSSKYYDFDVTSFVAAQLTGDKTVSLMIKDPANNDLNFAFNSKENAQNKPVLLIVSNGKSAVRTNDFASLPADKFSNSIVPVLPGDLAKVRVYPNPLHNIFNVEFAKGNKGEYDLQIVDPVGRVYELGKSSLKPGKFNNVTEIDVSKLALKTGIYFLRIQSGTKQTEIIKLILE